MKTDDTVDAVERMQKYIDGHIHEKITLKQLAQAADYSPWHSARKFKELTGRTPFEYIRALRLSKAALTLRDKEHRIIDVAFDFVFDSHEGFTRAFSKEFGLSPKSYAKKKPPIQLFIPTSIQDYHRFLNRGEIELPARKTLFVQVIDRPARKLLLKRGVRAAEYFAYCEEVGCDIWPLLTSVKKLCMNPLDCGCQNI